MNNPVSWAAVCITLSSSQRPGRLGVKRMPRLSGDRLGFGPGLVRVPTVPSIPILSTSKMQRQDLRLMPSPVSLRLLSEELPNMLFQVDWKKSKLVLTYSVKFATSTTGWVQLTLPQQQLPCFECGTKTAHVLKLAFFCQALHNYRYSSRALNRSGMYMMFSRPRFQRSEKQTVVHNQPVLVSWTYKML